MISNTDSYIGLSYFLINLYNACLTLKSDQFISGPLIQTLWDDSYESTRPLKIPVQSPSLIKKLSDRLSAVKGTALLRMLESVAGETEFQNGLKVTCSKKLNFFLLFKSEFWK